MAKITLPFWNQGQPFEPKIYPEDLADFEDLEVAAAQAEKPNREILRCHTQFVEKILSREAPSNQELRLTVADVRGAIKKFLGPGLQPEVDRPLASGGASSAPSSLPG